MIFQPHPLCPIEDPHPRLVLNQILLGHSGGDLVLHSKLLPHGRSRLRSRPFALPHERIDGGTAV